MSEDSIDNSRRSFLKKIGIGAAGLGALTVTPAASKLKITENSIIRDGNTFLGTSSLNIENPINFNQNEAQGFVVEKRSSDPENPVEGQLWINTSV